MEGAYGPFFNGTHLFPSSDICLDSAAQFIIFKTIESMFNVQIPAKHVYGK